MDKQTLILELIGLSRVVDGSVRNLVYKRHAVAEMADSYEPENPFLVLLDNIEAELMEATQNSIFANLSTDERRAFTAQWTAMRPEQQLSYLDRYVRGQCK